MRAKGAGDDDIYRMRSKELDASAAARLIDDDREEMVWKSRIARHQDGRSKVLASAPESERQMTLSQ
jgi:lipase chaperone LimK